MFKSLFLSYKPSSSRIIYSVFWQWAHQNGKACQEVIDEDNTTDQVSDLQRRLERLWSVDGRSALPLSILHHDGGNIELVLVSVVACLDGESLEESDADADNTHGHTATNQQQKAHAEAQADLCHNESAVGGVETVNGVVPTHCWECGQDEGHHPDAHHSVHCLLLGVAQPETQPHILDQVSRAVKISIKTGFGSIFVSQV